MSSTSTPFHTVSKPSIPLLLRIISSIPSLLVHIVMQIFLGEEKSFCCIFQSDFKRMILVRALLSDSRVFLLVCSKLCSGKGFLIREGSKRQEKHEESWGNLRDTI